jgi:His/Glu/Gln/Arg/opine family amino acid ABC transporter permease subunit
MPDFVTWIPVLAQGFVVTLELAAVTCLFAFALAAAVAVSSISRSRSVRLLARSYVEIFRSIPILALLFFLYYGLGPLTSQLGISAFWIAVAALSVIEAAYLAEIFRAALQSVTSAQWDAGESLGLGWAATLRLVIFPQAVPSALPGATNMMITIIKDTSLASLVAVNEITLAANNLIGVNFEPIQVFALLALFYLVLVVLLSLAARRLERIVARAIGLEERRSVKPPRYIVGRAGGA